MRKIYFDNFPSIRYNLMVQCQVKNVENFSHKWHDKHDKHDKHDILLPRHHHGLDDDVCWTDLGQLGRGEDGGDEEGHGELQAPRLPPLPPAPRDPGPPEGEELPLLRQRRPGGRKGKGDILCQSGYYIIESHGVILSECNSIRRFSKYSH